MWFGNEWIDISARSLTIALDDRDDTIFATVSPEDYDWLIQWRWTWRYNKRGRKRYAQRNTRQQGTPITIFMHKAILERSGKVRPTLFHTMGDHQDGDSLNNQRGNLEWATPSDNCRTARR